MKTCKAQRRLLKPASRL